MTQLLLAHPGSLWGTYPERTTAKHRRSALFALTAPVRPLLGRKATNTNAQQRALKIYTQLQKGHRNQGDGIDHSAGMISSSNFKASTLPTLRTQLRRTQCSADVVDSALLQVALLAKETLQWSAFRSQLECAILLIDQSFVELATGEGKSLAIALAACVLALAGSPVHTLTANEYLAKRDAEVFEPLYRTLDLSVAFTGEQSNSEAQRQAFLADITYTTARCVGFAYLKDGLSGQNSTRVLRGLCCALIDEADVILLDEAVTPLVLSQQVNDANERLMAFRAIEVARELQEHADWSANKHDRKLNASGQLKLEQLLIHPWLTKTHRQEQVLTALYALHDLTLGRDYVVQDKEIQIIDLHSGRIAQGRQWGNGLHAMLAVKEGIPTPKRTSHLASIQYPKLLQRYHHLAGLSGTLLTDKSEIEKTYQCPVFLVKPHHASQRQALPPVVLDTFEQALALLITRIQNLTRSGRPVLIATHDINQTQAVDCALQKAGLSATTLSAENETREASVIARAGHASAITIATQLAGRGTDIKLDSVALKAGGLAIISFQVNPSQRTDQQVMGRAGRQGQPGSTEQWLIGQTLDQYKKNQSISRAQDRFQRENALLADRQWVRRTVFLRA
jgi:preprotein translocase subunit SecA